MANSEPGEIVDFETLDAKDQQLIQKAVEVRNNAHCPVSKFQVGAALRTTNGDIFDGCNVESIAFSPTSCAERTAISKAVSEGHKKFNTVAVVAYLEDSFVSPCGVCRQMLVEFCEEETMVLLSKPEMKKVHRVKLFDLQPMAFTKF